MKYLAPLALVAMISGAAFMPRLYEPSDDAWRLMLMMLNRMPKDSMHPQLRPLVSAVTGRFDL
jgi:hypothetical protein